MLERSVDFVHEMLGDRVLVGSTGLTSGRQAIAPTVAVRELVVNAFMHADYALPGGPFRIAAHPDRVVVENPGLLVPGLGLVHVVGAGPRRRYRAAAAE